MMEKVFHEKNTPLFLSIFTKKRFSQMCPKALKHMFESILSQLDSEQTHQTVEEMLYGMSYSFF